MPPDMAVELLYLKIGKRLPREFNERWKEKKKARDAKNVDNDC
jgi:hypothetical protein